MSFVLFLDGIIATLLVVTIAYSVALNQKLKKLRAGEREMHAAIERFNASTVQAEANLARYKDIAARPNAATPGGTPGEGAAAGRALSPLVAEARKLAADLNLLIGRGETLIAEKSAAPRPPARPKRVRPVGRVDRANPQATWPLDDELDLIDALKEAR